jgi:hypothetical protein
MTPSDLDLREHGDLFWLLVATAMVGARVGRERSILPAVAHRTDVVVNAAPGACR